MKKNSENIVTKNNNLRTFVTEIIEIINNSAEFIDFHDLKEPQKNEKFKQLIIKLNNPILSLYTSYNLKNFIGDMCSDIKYNLKQQLDSHERSIRDFIELFLKIDDFDIKPIEQQTNITTPQIKFNLTFSYIEVSQLGKTIEFLYKCLRFNEEYLYYVLNIQDLLLPLLEFCQSLIEEIQKFEIKCNMSEILEMLTNIFKFLSLLFCEKKLLGFKLLISKSRFQGYLQLFNTKYDSFNEIKGILVETLDFLLICDRKNIEFLIKEFAVLDENGNNIRFFELWKTCLSIENVQDLETVVIVFKLSGFFEQFPLDYIMYSQILRKIRSFLSFLLKTESNKAKVFKNLIPKLFTLACQKIRIIGKNIESPTLIKAFDANTPNLNKLVFLPEIFEFLMSFLEELSDSLEKNENNKGVLLEKQAGKYRSSIAKDSTLHINQEICYIIEIFLRQIFGVLSQNDWNFCIIKENDYDILKKLIKLIGKFKDNNLNKQLLELILYIFTVFQRSNNKKDRGIQDLIELIKMLRNEDISEELRGLILTNLEKILEFFKGEFGEAEKEILWILCDLLLDIIRIKPISEKFQKNNTFLMKKVKFDKNEEIEENEGKNLEFKEKSNKSDENQLFSIENVESLIGIIKVVLRNNKEYLLEIKQNQLFKDLLLSLDYNSLEFLDFLVFLLKEELNFEPNSLNIYCELIEKEIIKAGFLSKNVNSLEKFHCLLLFIQKIFSLRNATLRKVFKRVFIENKNLIEAILKAFDAIISSKDYSMTSLIQYIDLIKEFLHNSSFLRKYIRKNPHFIKDRILKKLTNYIKTANFAEILKKILELSYIAPITNDKLAYAYLPVQALLIFPELISWTIQQELIARENINTFLQELYTIINKDISSHNAKSLLNSSFFFDFYIKYVEELEEVDMEVFLNTLIRSLTSTKTCISSQQTDLLRLFSLLLNYEKSHIIDNFIDKLNSILQETQHLSPPFIEFLSGLPLCHQHKLSIPRVKLGEDGISLFFWLNCSPSQSKIYEFSMLSISDALNNEDYLRIFIKNDGFWMTFLNYPETWLQHIDESQEWCYFGLVLEKKKEVFTINCYLNGFLKETRFYLIDRPLEMVYRLLKIDIGPFLYKEVEEEKDKHDNLEENCKNDENIAFFKCFHSQQSIKIGPMQGFRRNISESEALVLYLSTNESGLCDFFSEKLEINSSILKTSNNISKSLNFTSYLLSNTFEISLFSLENPVKLSKFQEISSENQIFSFTNCYFSLLYKDLSLIMTPTMNFLIKDEGILSFFAPINDEKYAGDHNFYENKLQMFLLTNPLADMDANFVNKTSEFLHCIYYLPDYIFDKETHINNQCVTLKKLLINTDFVERLLIKYGNSIENTRILKMVALLFENQKNLKEWIFNENSGLKAFIQKKIIAKAYINKEIEFLECIFKFFSEGKRLVNFEIFFDFFINSEIFKGFDKNQSKWLFERLSWEYLNENNCFFENNVKFLRNNLILDGFFQVLLIDESNGIERLICEILLKLMRGYKILAFSKQILQRILDLIEHCFYFPIKDKNPVILNNFLDKQTSKFFETLVSPKKLEILLEFSLETLLSLLEKSDISSKSLVFSSITPDFMLKLLYFRSIYPASELGFTYNFLIISQYLLRVFLMSYKGFYIKDEWITLEDPIPIQSKELARKDSFSYENFDNIIRILSPYAADQNLYQWGLIDELYIENGYYIRILLLYVLYQGIEMWKIIYEEENLKIYLKNEIFNEFEALSDINAFLKKKQTQTQTNITFLMKTPKIEEFLINIDKILDFFIKTPYLTINQHISSNIMKILIKIFTFNHKSVELYRKSEISLKIIEIIADLLVVFFKRDDETLNLDKLFLQLQSESPEEVYLAICEKLFMKLIILDKNEFQNVFSLFSQFSQKYIKKLIRRGYLEKIFEVLTILLKALDLMNSSIIMKNTSKSTIFTKIFQKGRKNSKTRESSYNLIHDTIKMSIIAMLNSLIVIEDKKLSIINENMSFLKDLLILLKEHSNMILDDKYEKDDFLYSLIYFIWAIINFSNEFPEALFLMQYFSFFQKKSLKRILKAVFSDIYTKFIDILNIKEIENTEKFLEKLKETAIFNKINQGMQEIFKAEYMAYNGNIVKIIKDDQNNPLIFTNELRFYENLKEKPENNEENTVLAFSELQKNLLELINSKTEFFIEKNRYLTINANFAEISIESEFMRKIEFLDNYEFFNKNHRYFDGFAFSVLKKVGFGCQKRLIRLKKAPVFVVKERILPAGLTHNNSKTCIGGDNDIISNNMIYKPTIYPLKKKNSDESSNSSESDTFSLDDIPDKSISLTENVNKTIKTSSFTVEIPAVPIKTTQKTEYFSSFLKLFAIFEENIEDCYETAYLKEREQFIEALIFLTASDDIYIILGFKLNDKGLIESSSEPIDKSKWLNKPRKDSTTHIIYEKTFSFQLFDIRYKEYKRKTCIYKRDIIELHAKRYWLQPCAIEIFTSEKQYFLIFNLFERENIYKRLIQSICGGPLPKLSSKKHQLLFTFFYPVKGKALYTSNKIAYPSTKAKVMHNSTTINLDKDVSKVSASNNSNIYPSQQKKSLVQKSSTGQYRYKSFNSHGLLRLILPLWRRGLMSNFEYMMLLNFLSGRTYSDLSQYPVFPWVLSNYYSLYGELDLSDINNYRDLSKPIGALTEERVKLAREKYESTSEERTLFPAFHYGSHYSSAVLVLYYLLRLMPYAKYAINLQGGHFDLSDRLFHNFNDTWTLANNLDYKELIPELYYLPEFLININNFAFGKTQTDQNVLDIILPDWCLNDPRYFVNLQRKALENTYISQKLNLWFDLIFGYKQKGVAAVNSYNLFYFLTYEDAVDLNLYTDPMEKAAILDQINEYGQTPKQLFKKPHPQRKSLEKPTFFLYEQPGVLSIVPEIYGESNSNNREILDIITNFDDYRPYRRLLLSAGSNGLRSSKIFANFLGNLIEQEEIASNLLPLKVLVKKLLEKEENSAINTSYGLSYKGECVISMTLLDNGLYRRKLLNWDNCYNVFMLIEQIEKPPFIEKPIEFDIKAVFSKDFLNITMVTYNKLKRYIVIGTESGKIAIYAYNKRLVKGYIKKTYKGLRNYLYKDDNSVVFKPASPIYQLNDKKIYVIKKGDYSSMRSQTMDLSHGNQSPSRENNSNFKEKNINIEDIYKKTSLELKFILKGAHFNKITQLEFNMSYSILISCDLDGVIAFWDLNKGGLIRKIIINHYQDYTMYEEIYEKSDFKNIKIGIKHHYPRQKILNFSISEENGDFLVVSKNYVSIYTINGVLLAIELAKEHKFTTGLLTRLNNNSFYEDDYIITGHNGGDISFWILKLNKANGEKGGKGSSFNRFTEHYCNKLDRDQWIKGVIVPYKLQCIYKLFGVEHSGLFEEGMQVLNSGLNVLKIQLSQDQKKLFSYHKNRKLLCWKMEEIDQNLLKKCVSCGSSFGILDKKTSCSSCSLYLCVPCSKFELIIPEINLRKPSKVCEKCYKQRYVKKSLNLYDNY